MDFPAFSGKTCDFWMLFGDGLSCSFQELNWECYHVPRIPAASGSVAFRYTAEADDVGNLHSLSAVKKSGRTIGLQRCTEMHIDALDEIGELVMPWRLS